MLQKDEKKEKKKKERKRKTHTHSFLYTEVPVPKDIYAGHSHVVNYQQKRPSLNPSTKSSQNQTIQKKNQESKHSLCLGTYERDNRNEKEVEERSIGIAGGSLVT